MKNQPPDAEYANLAAFLAPLLVGTGWEIGFMGDITLHTVPEETEYDDEPSRWFCEYLIINRDSHDNWSIQNFDVELSSDDWTDQQERPEPGDTLPRFDLHTPFQILIEMRKMIGELAQ